MATLDNFSFPTYRFRVVMGDDQILFSKVSGLESSLGVGFGNESSTAVNISLSRGIFIGSQSSQLYQWISSIRPLQQGDKKDISICFTNETGSEVLTTWNVLNAFPTKLTAPGFDAASNELAIEELCLRADSATITYH